MKRFFLILFPLLFLAGCASQVPLTQKTQLNSVVVGYFDFSSEELEASEYADEATGLVPDLITAYRTVKAIENARKAETPPGPSPEAVLRDSLYSIFESGIRQKLGITLLPIDTLRGRVRYDRFGFPRANCKKLAAQGPFDAVLKVTIYLSFPQKKTTSSTLLFKGKVVDEFKPQVTVHVQMFDRRGTVIWNRTAKVKSPEYMVLTCKYLLGIETKEEMRTVSIPALFAGLWTS